MSVQEAFVTGWVLGMVAFLMGYLMGRASQRAEGSPAKTSALRETPDRKPPQGRSGTAPACVPLDRIIPPQGGTGAVKAPPPFFYLSLTPQELEQLSRNGVLTLPRSTSGPV